MAWCHNPIMAPRIVALAGLLGALAVGLGAFGAHGLEGALAGAEDLARRLDWWDTATHYHLTHALALGVTAWARTRAQGRAPTVAAALFLVGVLLFSGTLYAMTLGAPRWLGAITPLGGLALIGGWLSLAMSARTWKA